jgi:RND family efflux transporter MFP subunit
MFPARIRTPMSNYVNKRSLIYGGSVALALAIAGVGGASLAAGDAEVETPTTQPRHVLAAHVQQDVGASEWLTGVVQSNLALDAASVSGGRVVSVMANVGDMVFAGQGIAIIDNTAAQLRTSQAAAEVARAQAVASERAMAAQRANGMAQSGAIAPAERDAVAAEAASARAAVAAAQAAYRASAHEASLAIIRAPAQGIVSERTVNIGAVVAPGQKLFSIEGANEKVILAAAPQRLSGRLRVGQTVSFVTDTQRGQGEIIGISPRVADGGVVPIRIRVTNGGPLVGSVVQVSVQAGSANAPQAVRVPASALILDQRKQHFIYKIGADKKAQRVAVTVIGFSGGDARIAGKLQNGEAIIAAGGSFVAPGQVVAIARPGA